jgi:sugar fermentation stimulation protein A
MYLEVKSAVLREGGFAMYPDCPSLRGQRHVEDLTDWARGGGLAMVVFMAALPGVKAFKPNRSADSRIYEHLVRAQKEGIRIKSLGLFYDPMDSQICMFSPNLKVTLNAR